MTKQIDQWSSEFGKKYTDRNPQSIEEMDSLYFKNFGIKRTQLNDEFLGQLKRDIKILEVGCNVGSQLQALKKMGFQNLYGIELQNYAVELAKAKTQGVNIIQGSAFDIPFKDGFFDLVYTSGVLIHLNPEMIHQAFSEIYRCSSKYIWGFEYYADSYTEVIYRGEKNLMWKADFASLYKKDFTDLSLVKEKKVKYLDNENIDSMFLLKK